MNIKHFVFALSLVFLLPVLFLSADRGGGGGDIGRGGHDNNDPYSSYDNPTYNYGNEGVIGGGFYGEYINPYPPPGSMPGMSDDSNALYDSYLKSNQSQSYFKE